MISGVIAADPGKYSYKMGEGNLTRGGEIKIRGNFSGTYMGLARAELLTDTKES